MAQRSPEEILASAVESSRNFKFGRGVVSKTSYVAASVIAVWTVIVLRWGDNMMTNAGLLVAGLVATGFAGWHIKSSQNFAERNPAQALLEGAELLEWQKTAVQAKGFPPVANPLLVEDRGSLILPDRMDASDE